MITQSVFEEQFMSNHDISAAKKLLSEMKSVRRVAEAVDSIIIPATTEENELGKFQVVILSGWDENERSIRQAIQENCADNGTAVAEWSENDKSYFQVCNESLNFHESRRQEFNDEDQDSEQNLSWLLNFKVETLFNSLDKNCDCGCEENPAFAEGHRQTNGHNNKERSQRVPQISGANATSRGVTAAAGAPSAATNLKKPPFTYTELIEQALREKGELTVSGIYKWISLNFPYYRPDDDRWKNSVRHNLSINPHFSKGSKARKGAGHLWTVVTGEDRSRSSWKRRRLEQFVNEQREREAAAQHQEADDAARHIAGEAGCNYNGVDQEGWITTQIISLEQSAEDILMGVKREVEVEYLTAIPADEEAERSCGSADSDFLNPVSKHEAVKESGLLSDEGLVPVSYGDIHLSHPSTEDAFFSDEELTLQYYELALATTNQ